MGSPGHKLSGQLTLFRGAGFCNGAAMAELINLRLARKARTRSKAAQQAAENRALHGQSLAERRLKEAEAERKARHFDAHRREQD